MVKLLLVFNQSQHHTDIWWSGGVTPCNLSTTLYAADWLASYSSHITLRKVPWNPFDKWIGGPQNQPGCCGRKKNLSLPGTEPFSSNP
jgi:hypothetical protein